MKSEIEQLKQAYTQRNDLIRSVEEQVTKSIAEGNHKEAHRITSDALKSLSQSPVKRILEQRRAESSASPLVKGIGTGKIVAYTAGIGGLAIGTAWAYNKWVERSNANAPSASLHR